METLTTPPKPSISSNFLMSQTSANLKTALRFFSYSKAPTFFTSSAYLPVTHQLIHAKSRRKRGFDDGRVRVSVKMSNAELKENWLDSLCCPLPEKIEDSTEEPSGNGVGLDWIIGIDPDLSGALALLKPHDSGFSAQVFDNPYVQVLVGKRVRKRLDAKSIVQMLRSFDAPLGTTAYIEQSLPFPQDGKQGWWSGGFGYGMWIGVLVASGFSVVPVPSSLWKNHFELSGSLISKDDSREAASALFPSLSSLLKRKKDHGRAEALLIAAYGKGLKRKSDSSIEIKSGLCTKSDLGVEIKADLCTNSNSDAEIKLELCTTSI